LQCKVSSIIMTVAIDAHDLPLVDFYALALLASRFFAFIAPGYAGASDHDKSILQFFIKRLDLCARRPEKTPMLFHQRLEV
jgi:hypothetical protein